MEKKQKQPFIKSEFVAFKNLVAAETLKSWLPIPEIAIFLIKETLLLSQAEESFQFSGLVTSLPTLHKEL